MKALTQQLTKATRKAVHIALATLAMLFTTACSIFGVESVEEAPYQVVQQDGQFEIRDYAPMVVAETRVDANFKKAGNSAFRKLFAYISGKNTASEKIAMTSPVVAEQKAQASGEKIAMTAPVTARKDGDTWLYRFVLPQTYTIDNAPVPLDPQVSLAEVPQKRVATVRFSGRSTESARERHTKALTRWMESQKLPATSKPRWAGYNAPWALPPFRRNEVLIDISDE